MTISTKNFQVVATTSATSIYTCTVTSAQLVESRATNKTITSQTITVEFYDASAATWFEYCKNTVIPAYTSVDLLAGRRVFEQGDMFRISATANDSVVFMASVAEQS